MVRTVRVTHEPFYADPIRLEAGEALTLSGTAERWDGHLWLWAKAPDGREGWIPDDLVDRSASTPIARTAYSAVELSCDVGERLVVTERRHGWAWCRNAGGDEGWVPLRNLAEHDV